MDVFLDDRTQESFRRGRIDHIYERANAFEFVVLSVVLNEQFGRTFRIGSLICPVEDEFGAINSERFQWILLCERKKVS